MTSKHTPGPWTTDEKDHDAPYLDIQIKGKWNICKVWIDDAPVRDYNAEQYANARLIAAAPDLLGELENCLDLLVTCFSDSPVDSCMGVAITKARAAIAKATGETQ